MRGYYCSYGKHDECAKPDCTCSCHPPTEEARAKLVAALRVLFPPEKEEEE